MTRAKQTTVFVLFLLTVLVVGFEASARTERLRWVHPQPATVDGFRVYYGTASGVYTSQVDVGIPPTDAEQAFVYDLEVPDAATVYVAVTAIGGGLESDLSNEKMRSPSQPPAGIGTPGRPTLVPNP